MGVHNNIIKITIHGHVAVDINNNLCAVSHALKRPYNVKMIIHRRRLYR